MIVAVTGPDGSGKSTACSIAMEKLGGRFGAGSVARVSVWDAVAQSGLFRSKSEVVRYLDDLNGYTRTLFIYHSLSRALDVARRGSAKLLLVEGYWYKYAITEIGQGVPEDVTLAAARGFPRPDLTICLDIDPETAWARKQGASRYEQGVDTDGSPAERFLSFQRRVAPLWTEFASRFGPWTHVSARHEPAAVADALIEKAERCLCLL